MVEPDHAAADDEHVATSRSRRDASAHRADSLRRHDPEQVQRSAAAAALSARCARTPVSEQLNRRRLAPGWAPASRNSAEIDCATDNSESRKAAPAIARAVRLRGCIGIVGAGGMRDDREDAGDDAHPELERSRDLPPEQRVLGRCARRRSRW